MDRRHKALVLATTLVVVLSILGFIFVAGALAHGNHKIHVRTVDDASDWLVSYSFDGPVDATTRVHAKDEDHDGVLLGSGHGSNKLAIDVAPEGDAGLTSVDARDDARDDASGSGEDEDANYVYDEDRYFDQDDQDEGDEYDQYDQDECGEDGQLDQDVDDARSSTEASASDDVDQHQTQQQTQQQDQQQTQQQDQQQGQQESKELMAAPPPDDSIFGCGVDGNVLKACSKPTSRPESELFRVSRTIAELSYLNYECTGVLLGNSTENAYLLTAAECVYHDTLARKGVIGIKECKHATLHTYYYHALYHVNRRLGYVIIKMNAGGRDTDSIATYARLSHRGAIVGMAVLVPSYSMTYGQSVAITYNRKPITIQTYKPTGVQSIMNQGFCPNMTDTTGHVTYMANSMDGRTRGSPVFSVADGSVVALHLCGACIFNSSNTALSSKSIVDDLKAHGKLRSEFVAP